MSFFFSIFLVPQRLLLVRHLLQSPLSSQLAHSLPTCLLTHCFFACSFLYLFITYLPTHLPICLLPHCLFASLVIRHLFALPAFVAWSLHVRLFKYPLNLLLLTHHLLLYGTTPLFTCVSSKARSKEANCSSSQVFLKCCFFFFKLFCNLFIFPFETFFFFKFLW